MARLIYGMLTSLDGYTEDARGAFGWGAPEDEAVHSYINQLASSVGTYRYGRRMYETMVYWHDIIVAGPELAAEAVRLGLVDEFQMTSCPAIVGGGKRFFPEGVRLNLALVEERRFGNGVVVLRHAVRPD